MEEDKVLKLKNCSILQFSKIAEERKVYGFGVSIQLNIHIKLRTPDFDLTDMVDVLVDNDKKKVGSFYRSGGKEIPVISVSEMLASIKEEDVLIILSNQYGEIVEDLDQYNKLEKIDTYILRYIDDFPDSELDENQFNLSKSKEFQIPPVIHYCWFGENKMPDKYLTFIESWKKYCPDYQIKKWDETNYDINKHPYMRSAYLMKKWAFVSDYARLDIIYNHGGIYLDSDVELLQSLDELRKFQAYLGYESTQMINTGLGFGAGKGNKIIKELRDAYDKVDFPGEGELTPCTVHQTQRLRMLGLKCNNSFQIIGCNEMAILPTDFLCGIRLETRKKQITRNTVSLHHWCGDWGSSKEQIKYGEMLREKYDNQLLRRLPEPLEFEDV